MANQISDAELVELFRAEESERVERKQSLGDRDRICHAICAFANDLPGSGLPGIVIIGQRDDLSCAGIAIDDQLLNTIGGWRGDGKFQPFPTISVAKRLVDGCEVAVVAVAPSENTPVRFDGRVWIRVGPRRAIASTEEERRLTERRNAAILPFDAQGISDAAIEDIDLVRFNLEYLPAAIPADVLAQNGRTEREQMRAMRLLDARDHPTGTALLVLGKDPQRFFPGAYVEALRIGGQVLTDPILDRHTITGTIPDQLRRLDELVDLWIETATRVGAERREDRPAYPAVGLRQLLRNAVLHRNYDHSNAPVRLTWYEDRIEISSPGGLYGAVTPENFGKPGVTDYRNPTLAEALRSLGYVEKFGVGLQIAADELRKNGNPEYLLDADHGFVLLTLGKMK